MAVMLQAFFSASSHDLDMPSTPSLMRGARGYAARDAYVRELRERPEHFVNDFRRLLAQEMQVEPDSLPPAALRGFFERRVAFGNHRLLTHMASLLARFWELGERGQGPQLQAAIAAGAAFVEQAAIDNGRLEVAWLATGLPPPPASTSAPRPAQPSASLLPPRWWAANLEFLRDRDYLATRTAGSEPKAKAAGEPKAEPNAKAKAKAKARAAAAAAAAAES